MTPGALRIRRQLIRIIREYPALHLRELARQASISEPLAVYHLNALQAQGLVQSKEEKNYRRFYAPNGHVPTPRESGVLILLRHRLPLEIVTHLLENGAASSGELAKALGYARTTMVYHLQKLETASLIERRDGAYVVREPPALERLLIKWRPPEAFTNRFSRFWDVFYRNRRREND